jgi:hypothetical protein
MHDRFDWVGRADALEDADVGIVATFRIADTDAGDAWLADHGPLVKLSPEVRNIVRDDDDNGSAELTGAALVDEGAFADAALFSIDKVEATFHGVQHDPGPRPDETEPAPAAPEPEPDEEPDEEKEEGAVADAVAPQTMLGGRRPKATEPSLSAHGFFAALNRARATADPTALQPYMESGGAVDKDGSGLFALTDIKYDQGGLAEVAAIPGGWLGQLWAGKAFNRTIVPLLTQGTLTGIKTSGWMWLVKPSMATWTGNKSAVPSNTPTVTPKDFFAQRFAGGHDLAREYYDFNQTEVIDSYVRAMVDSYAVLSDSYALTQLDAGATAFTIVAATTNKALSAIVDGALAVVAAQAVPAYAIVAPNVFRDLVGTPHSTALEYFNATVGITGGSAAGLPIIPDSRLAAGKIIVGAKEAATAWELPGVPIRVSAPDLVKGGIDEAFFGYIAVGVTYPAAVVKATLTLP